MCGTIFLTTRLLPTPGYKSHSSLGSESKFLEHSEGLKDCNESSSIIVSPSLWSRIPRVNMPSSKNNLIRLFCTLDLKDQIIGICIAYKLSLYDQMYSNILSSILHPSEHFRVLDRNCRTRYFWVWRIILHIPCVYWIDTLWSYWSY